MPGERRLTSIKQLINDMMFHNEISGTITIDEITNTVTVQLVEPVTIDGTIAVSSIGGVVNTSTTITNNPLDIREQPVALTISQTVTTLNAVSQTILAANANRKYLLIRNSSSSDALIYIRFNASAANLTNSLPLRKGEYFESPEDFTYTGAITAISSAFGADTVAVLEGT